MPDAHANFAYGVVLTAPNPATSGTSLAIDPVEAATFPAVPFNAKVWPNNQRPLASNSEIVRVTAINGGTLTVSRAQEGSAARAIVPGDQVAQVVTAKAFTDIAVDIAAAAAGANAKQPRVYALLANGTLAMGFAANNVVKVTPTANGTYTTTVPPAGTLCTLIILTSGATSRTITFGSGFKPVGTLATGTANARVFVISWVSDGTVLYEVSRTAAMVA